MSGKIPTKLEEIKAKGKLPLEIAGSSGEVRLGQDPLPPKSLFSIAPGISIVESPPKGIVAERVTSLVERKEDHSTCTLAHSTVSRPKTINLRSSVKEVAAWVKKTRKVRVDPHKRIERAVSGRLGDSSKSFPSFSAELVAKHIVEDRFGSGTLQLRREGSLEIPLLDFSPNPFNFERRVDLLEPGSPKALFRTPPLEVRTGDTSPEEIHRATWIEEFSGDVGFG